MNKCVAPLCFCFIIFFSFQTSYAQIWRQYSDSAATFQKQYRIRDALKYFIKAHSILQKDSTETNTKAENNLKLGDLYLYTGEYKKTEILFLEAKKIKAKIFGQDHAEYAKACQSLGRLYTLMGEYKKAEDEFIVVKDLLENIFGKESIEFGLISSYLGDLYRVMDKYEKAEPFLLVAREILARKAGTENIDYALSCYNLGCLYWYTFQNKKAEALLLEAKNIRAKKLGKGSIEYAYTCTSLGSVYVNMDSLTNAEFLFEDARSIWAKILGKISPDYAYSCFNLGSLYSRTNRAKKAEPLLVEARDILGKTVGKDHLDYALSCAILGDFYYNHDQFNSALIYYLEAKKIRGEKAGESVDYAISCNSVGSVYRTLGQYEKAKSFFFEAKEIRERLQGKQHPDYAESCNSLGTIYWFSGDFEKAEPLLIEAKQIWEDISGKQSINYAQRCNTLAGLYKDMGQYRKAESLLLEAREVRKKVTGANHNDYAESCNSLGGLYWNIKNYEKAEPLLLEAKSIKEVLGQKNSTYALICNNLGDLYMELGQYDKAEKYYIEAKEIFESTMGPTSYDYALSVTHLGVLYTRKGQLEKAEDFLLEGKMIREALLGKENPDYATSCMNLAEFYYASNEYEKAEKFFLEAERIYKKRMGTGYSDYGITCNSLGRLYWNLNQIPQAYSFYKGSFHSQSEQVRKTFQFTSETEKISFLKNTMMLWNGYLSFLTSTSLPNNNEFAFDIVLFNRHLTLNSSENQRQFFYNTSDTAFQKKFEGWIELREKLSYLYTRPSVENAKRRKQLESKADALEKEITRISSAFRKEKEKEDISWKKIQQSLQEDEVAIEFTQFEYYNGKQWTDSVYYVALLVKKNAPAPEMVPLFEKRQLDSILNYKGTSPGQHQLSTLYASTNDGDNERSLYHAIWEPIEKKLEDIKTIYFAPAGELYKIAFAALPINTTQFLSDRYKLVQLNSTASVINKETTAIAATDRIAMYGGIEYDVDSVTIKQVTLKYSTNDISSRAIPADLLRAGLRDFYYLPGSEKEVKAIADMAVQKKYENVSVQMGIEATEESFKSLSERKSPAIIHIATHGFFFSDPKGAKRNNNTGGAFAFQQSDIPLIRSGLVFAGANNAWKNRPVSGVQDGILTAYEVSNMNLPNTKLVVLSACETGLGDIQGSEGIYGLQRAFKIAGAQNLVMSLWKVDDTATSEFMQEFYKGIFENENIKDAFYHAQTVLRNKYGKDVYKWGAWILVR